MLFLCHTITLRFHSLYDPQTLHIFQMEKNITFLVMFDTQLFYFLSESIIVYGIKIYLMNGRRTIRLLDIIFMKMIQITSFLTIGNLLVLLNRDKIK